MSNDRNEWAEKFKDLTPKQREEVKDQILELVKIGSQPGNKQLYAALKSPDYEFVGVMPFILYNRVTEIEGPDDLIADWIHKWGFPTLIFGHKRSSHLVIVNPWIRVSNSVINESKGNPRVHIEKGQVTG